MNVTLKLPDDLGKAAKHRAIDESTSLSKWVADLVKRELSSPPPVVSTTPRKSLMEMLAVKEAPDSFYEKDFPLENRSSGSIRKFSFNDE